MTKTDLRRFADHLKKPTLEEWQLRQAQDAIELYRRFRLREHQRTPQDPPVPGTWDSAIIAS